MIPLAIHINSVYCYFKYLIGYKIHILATVKRTSLILKLSSNFSVVYHKLLQDLVQTTVPTESWADCSDCHLCANEKDVRSHTKCCDFTPSLPNYIAGSILHDNTDEYREGRSRILNTLENKLGVTPFGIFPSLNYQQRFSESRKDKAEVTQQSVNNLKCPYYQNGDCTIYAYRTDLCGFYHCSSVALGFGKKFWKDAREFNVFLDKTLSIYVAEQLGFKYPDYPSKLKKLSSQIEHGNGELNKDEYQKMWGNWYGNEINYFLECEKLFHSLESKELTSILGDQFEKKKLELLHSSKALHSNKVPDYLIYNHKEWEKVYYSDSNTEQTIRPAEHLILKHFDGKTKTEIIVKKGKRFKTNMTPLLMKSLESKILQPVKTD